MSRIGRAAARLALGIYPPAWRDRYGQEVSDLITQTDSSLTDAVDLARSALRESLEEGNPMHFELARRHAGGFALVAMLLVAPTLGVVAVSLLGHELGITSIASVFDPIVARIDTVGPLDLFLLVAPAVAFFVAVLPLVDVRIERDDEAPAVALRVRALRANLVVGAIALLVGAALVAHLATESVLGARA